MSKAHKQMKTTKKRLSKAEVVAKLAPTPKRDFNPQEVVELQEMMRLINSRKFEAAQVKANTALVPRGKEIAEELEAIARLIENIKNQFVSLKLEECGYPNGTKCNINMTSGEITLTKEENVA